MTPRALFLVACLALVGCVAPEEDRVESASAEPTREAAAPAVEGPADAARAADRAPDVTASPIEIEFSYAGTTPSGACVVVACEFDGGAEDFHLIEFTGAPQRLAITVTYGAQLPGHEFYVAVCHGEDEAADCADYETGPSPLSIERDLTALAAGTPVGISVGSLSTAGAAGGVMTFGAAEFSVEGVLVAVA